jgi:DNA-binding beta-propeller fold protein YncE
MHETRRIPTPGALALAVALMTTSGCLPGPDRGGEAQPAPAGTHAVAGASYVLYVVAESADLLHRVRFDPDVGARVERQTYVGELFTEREGPHGLAIDARRGRLFVSTAHGVPDGKLWAYEIGPDTLVARPILLGQMPASLDITPDGMFVLVANFNLHGEMEPSSVSVVLAGDMVEVARVETCTMPHGSRVSPDGRWHYSVCMMDDQLVQLDLRSRAVSRRFALARGQEGALDPSDRGHHALPSPPRGRAHRYTPGCSPTWADTDPTGQRVYVACNRSDEVLEIDAASWTLLRRFPTGRGPYNLEVSPDGRTLVVTLKQGHAVEFFDLESGESMARTATSTRVVHGVVISPDGRYAFVSVEGVGAEPGKVDVFELGSFQRVADVEVGQQAAGIAFWRLE